MVDIEIASLVPGLKMQADQALVILRRQLRPGGDIISYRRHDLHDFINLLPPDWRMRAAHIGLVSLEILPEHLKTFLQAKAIPFSVNRSRYLRKSVEIEKQKITSERREGRRASVPYKGSAERSILSLLSLLFWYLGLYLEFVFVFNICVCICIGIVGIQWNTLEYRGIQWYTIVYRRMLLYRFNRAGGGKAPVYNTLAVLLGLPALPAAPALLERPASPAASLSGPSLWPNAC